MAATTPVSELISQVRQRANQENSALCSDNEILSYLQGGVKALGDMINEASGSHFSNSRYTFVTTGSTDLYDLPDDFLDIRGLEVQWVSGYPGRWITVSRFAWGERNQFSGNGCMPAFCGRLNMFYELIGDQVRLAPPPPAGVTLRMDYVPVTASLCSTATVDLSSASIGDSLAVGSNTYVLDGGSSVRPDGKIGVAYSFSPPMDGVATIVGATGQSAFSGGVTYLFYLTSVDHNSNESSASPPISVLVLNDSSNIVVSFSSAAGAVKYRLYGNDSQNTPFLFGELLSTHLVAGVGTIDLAAMFEAGGSDHSKVAPISSLPFSATWATTFLATAISANESGLTASASGSVVSITQKPSTKITKWSCSDGVSIAPSGSAWSSRASDYNGWLEYAVIRATMLCKNKEDQDVSLEAGLLKETEERIRKATWNRNVGEFNHVADNSGNGWWGGGNGGWNTGR